jgi:alanine racemase
MEKLADIIRPTIGILTNIGQAHSRGFGSQDQKLKDKFKLFIAPKIVIGPENLLKNLNNKQPIFSWGHSVNADLQVLSIQKESDHTTIQLFYKGNNFDITIPFTDDASQENGITCCCVLLYLGCEHTVIAERMLTLHAVEMRLQSNAGINHCTIINDSYSADLTSLNIALNFLQQQHTRQQLTVILSNFVETGKTDTALYKAIAENLIKHDIQKVVAIGEAITNSLPGYLPATIKLFAYKSIEIFINEFQHSMFQNEMILVKGARSFRFERIVQLLHTKVHQTILEVNLTALAYNLKEYQKILHPQTRIMAMVKAFAYGSGGAEIARVLQFNNIDNLGVAYADEGVDLRKAGISVPIMVMNVDSSSFGALTEFNLHPVIYSFQLITEFEEYLKEQGLNSYPVHIEIESGMNRLGFSLEDINKLAKHLKSFSFIKIETVFSHLAASEDPTQDAFTNEQAIAFNKAVSILESFISYPFLKHVANSAAIIRHPHLQMDMVRLGVGLYGIEIATNHLHLQPVATLRSTIAQLKNLKAGDTISYNRKGVVKDNMVVATVRIGYADGYSRQFSNGVGKMWINARLPDGQGKLAPVVGVVCMDMTMIDVTDVTGVNEGDEVIIFGKELPLQLMAEWANIIPYEIMTSVSQRVKRVYFQE